MLKLLSVPTFDYKINLKSEELKTQLKYQIIKVFSKINQLDDVEILVGMKLISIYFLSSFSYIGSKINIRMIIKEEVYKWKIINDTLLLLLRIILKE